MTTEPFIREAATVAEVALAYPQSIGILNQYQLDFCCNGNQSFSQACKNARLDPEAVWNEIMSASGQPVYNRLHFENWTSSMLVDFIIQHHHEYVRESIPRIRELLEKICNVHGDTNPELVLVKSDFYELADELLNHLPKEEHVLFPAIKQIEAQNGGRVEDIDRSAFAAPVRVMEEEHQQAGALIKSIRSRTDNYTVPVYACPTYQLAFQLLHEFDQDLMQHIHLENNILFPRVSPKFNNN